jgi:large subunit ribosomal protein L21
MYAVLKAGGKQYCVKPGSLFSVEKIEQEVGQDITFNEILLLNDGTEVKVGRPVVKGAVVTAQVVRQYKAPKVLTFKKLKRQDHRLKKGHRQNLTQLKVTGIVLS